MKQFRFTHVSVIIFSLLVFAFPSWGEEQRQPDPSHPFGPSGRWFPDQAGWKLGKGALYSIHLLCDPPLTYAGAEPIGFCMENISMAVGKAKDENPAPAAPKACSFEGLIWTLIDQFGYSARVLIGPDGSLLGFSFRVWNNSREHPLTLLREPGAALLRTDFSIEYPKSPDGTHPPLCEGHLAAANRIGSLKNGRSSRGKRKKLSYPSAISCRKILI